MLATTTVAALKPRMRPPFEQYCLGPAPWAQLVKCANKYAPTAKILAKPSAKTQLVRISPYQTFLYVESPAGQWHTAAELDDDKYELVGERDVRLAKLPGVQIDLRHRIDLDGDGLSMYLTEKLALVCPAGGYCTRLVYACTVLTHGRAVETFRGEVVIADDGSVRADGDRSQSGPRCGSR